MGKMEAMYDGYQTLTIFDHTEHVMGGLVYSVIL